MNWKKLFGLEGSYVPRTRLPKMSLIEERVGRGKKEES
jgi:hypothetical protein